MKVHISLAHQIWKQHLKPTDIVIDATCGNGRDTLVLAELTPLGHVYACDIQSEAIETTRKRLQDFNSRITYIEGCHSVFPPEIAEGSVALVVYNLGYLPGGDQNLTTLTSTTLQSIESAKKLIKPNGLISITLYPGHLEGALETKAILAQVDSWNYELHESPRETAPKLLLLRLKM